MKRVFLLVLLPALLACRSKPEIQAKNILGTWKTDSIFQYTNGFVQTKTPVTNDDNIEYAYDSTGRLTMLKEAEQRSIRYRFVGDDSLVYMTAQGRYLNSYRIIKLAPGKLVLRKNLKPMFPGKNQSIYEIRVFSPAPADR